MSNLGSCNTSCLNIETAFVGGGWEGNGESKEENVLETDSVCVFTKSTIQAANSPGMPQPAKCRERLWCRLWSLGRTLGHWESSTGSAGEEYFYQLFTFLHKGPVTAEIITFCLLVHPLPTSECFLERTEYLWPICLCCRPGPLPRVLRLQLHQGEGRAPLPLLTLGLKSPLVRTHKGELTQCEALQLLLASLFGFILNALLYLGFPCSFVCF